MPPKTQIADNMNIPEGWMGLDIGHNAIAAFEKVIKNAKTILWNIQWEFFEMDNFQNGTKSIGNGSG